MMALFSFYRRNPFWLLTIGLMITFIIILVMSWNIYTNDIDAKKSLQRQITSETLRFKLAYYNNQVVSAARLITLRKNNQKNLKEYKHNKLLLINVFQAAHNFSQNNHLENLFIQLTNARKAMFKREDQAIELTKTNKRKNAQALLFNNQYEQDISAYNHATLQLVTALTLHQFWLELSNNIYLYYSIQINALNLLQQTHNKHWADIYQHYDTQINNSFVEAKNVDAKFLKDSHFDTLKEAYSDFNKENNKIITFSENKNYKKLKALFNSVYYINLRTTVQKHIQTALLSANLLVAKKIKKRDLDIVITITQVAVILFILLILWFVVLRLLRYWQAQLTQANKRLSDINRELDLKVEQRTRKLQLTNKQLTQEIHDRQQAEQQKSELQTALQQNQKLQSVGTLAAGIAHDFNNILAVILAHSEFLLKHHASNEQEHAVTSIIDSTHKASHLTQQLLTFARKGHHNKETIEVNHLIKDAVEMLNPNMQDNVVIETQLEKDLWPIRADSNQILQILINLGLNAKDAMGKRGNLLIRTQNKRVGQDLATSTPDLKPGKYVLVEISDNGCGIKQSDIPHIFDPFYTTKGVGKGTGLGLSVTYGIIQQHQGAIEVSSSLSKGTTFFLYLPA